MIVSSKQCRPGRVRYLYSLAGLRIAQGMTPLRLLAPPPRVPSRAPSPAFPTLSFFPQPCLPTALGACVRHTCWGVRSGNDPPRVTERAVARGSPLLQGAPRYPTGRPSPSSPLCACPSPTGPPQRVRTVVFSRLLRRAREWRRKRRHAGWLIGYRVASKVRPPCSHEEPSHGL